MALETLSTTELLNYLLHNSIPPPSPPLQPSFLSSSNTNNPPKSEFLLPAAGPVDKKRRRPGITAEPAAVVQERKKTKRRKRQKTDKDREEAESQRMNHITVERNRRKMMNEHLAVLRSLMPESYAQRGDQASIVGGAIDFLKELEHHLHTLEAQKHLLLIQRGGGGSGTAAASHNFFSSSATAATASGSAAANTTPFSQFFTNPQYICSKYENTPHHPQYGQCITTTSSSSITCSKDDDEGVAALAVADIEVTLIETHANVRILSRRRKVKQLSRLVTAFQSMYLTILHLNVTTLELDPLLVLYSISAKVEEGCVMSTADDIAGAVNHILRSIGRDEDHAHDH